MKDDDKAPNGRVDNKRTCHTHIRMSHPLTGACCELELDVGTVEEGLRKGRKMRSNFFFFFFLVKGPSREWGFIICWLWLCRLSRSVSRGEALTAERP